MRGWVAALCLAACSSGARAPAAATPAAPATRWTGSLSPPPAAGAEVVAEVNGERIYVADVEAQMRARGQTRDQALAELIDASLLAEEAYRRGLADDPEVRAARDREGVRQLVKRVFEPSFDGPEDVPEEEVETVYNLSSVHTFYEHDEYHTAAFCRVQLGPKPTDAEVETARASAEKLHALLVAAAPRTKEDFAGICKAHPELPTVQSKQPFTTALAGPAHPTFARAALALQKVGDISPPTRTPWGWDILFLDAIVPAKHTPLAEAYADIRKNRFEPSREAAFRRWVEGLVAGHQVRTNDAALEGVHVDSLVGMQ